MIMAELVAEVIFWAKAPMAMAAVSANVEVSMVDCSSSRWQVMARNE